MAWLPVFAQSQYICSKVRSVSVFVRLSLNNCETTIENHGVFEWMSLSIYETLQSALYMVFIRRALYLAHHFSEVSIHPVVATPNCFCWRKVHVHDVEVVDSPNTLLNANFVIAS